MIWKKVADPLDPQAVIKNASQSTLLIQSSTQDANVRIPKMIRWDETNLPNEWLLKNVSKPTRVVNDTSNLDYIQQYLDGSIKINFSDLNISNQIQRPLLIDKKKILLLTPQPLKDSIKEAKKLKIWFSLSLIALI